MGLPVNKRQQRSECGDWIPFDQQKKRLKQRVGTYKGAIKIYAQGRQFHTR
jgi:hypothetical protein